MNLLPTPEMSGAILQIPGVRRRYIHQTQSMCIPALDISFAVATSAQGERGASSVTRRTEVTQKITPQRGGCVQCTQLSV